MRWLKLAGELELLRSSLKDGFPETKHTYQLITDILEQSLEANLYVDQWPDFTTIVTQEFRPRLSEHADLRIYTINKENIMPLLTEAGLLDNTGNWQLIHYILSEEDCEEVASHLIAALKVHPKTKDKTSALVFNYMAYDLYDDSGIFPIANLSREYYIKKIPLETAEFVAKHWIPADVEYPLQYKTKFIEDLITHFVLLGAYCFHSNPEYPVAWVGMKPGGVTGLSYTAKEHRHRNLNAALGYEVSKYCMARGSKLLSESNNVNFTGRHYTNSSLGRSCAIAIF